MANDKQYNHPQYKNDRESVNTLMGAEATDFNLAELARLRIRYDGFPGAQDIRRDLDKVMADWGLTEASLFENTRAIHAGDEAIYQPGRTKKGEDWS
ncbi:MAG: DUF3288 family protein [Cyanobacteria bacterium P01_A01_bin.105]